MKASTRNSSSSHLARVTQSNKNRAARTAILHICASIDPESPGREVVSLASLTQRAGWRAIIASSGGRLINDAERTAVRHIRVPLNKNSMVARWRNYHALRSLALRERPAIIHAHGLMAAYYAAKVGKELRLPHVVDLTQPVAMSHITYKYMECIKRNHTTVRVPSEFMAQHLINEYGLDDDQIYRVQPGVDLQTYSARFISTERLQTLNQLWRLPEQAAVILVPAPTHPDYGHKIFLSAMAQLKHENIFAILAGREDNFVGARAEIESSIGELGLTGKIIMPDYCLDLPAACWLSSAVLAADTVPHGQNIELLAAQAIGRPVIVTQCGANTEMVLNGETAWIVPPNNVDALANALSQAVRLDTNQRLALADCAHNFIADNFPQSMWFNGIMEIYERLLQPSARQDHQRAAA
jgi:glycosyltransferase involved in cell wall biosynthesis